MCVYVCSKPSNAYHEGFALGQKLFDVMLMLQQEWLEKVCVQATSPLCVLCNPPTCLMIVYT